MRSPISPGERPAVTLRYSVSGDSMQTTSFSYRLGHSTVCYIIENTWEATFLTAPQSSEEWKRISDGFESVWNFPQCI